MIVKAVKIQHKKTKPRKPARRIEFDVSDV